MVYALTEDYAYVVCGSMAKWRDRKTPCTQRKKNSYLASSGSWSHHIVFCAYVRSGLLAYDGKS